MKNKKKLLAISGGADSILLAYLYRNQNIILAFVNYNIRHDTFIDQKIVEDFAQKYQLQLEILSLDQNAFQNQNFENWARNIRYDFFYQIYQKYNCEELLLAHHQDDFLETALMQYPKNKEKLFYGMKQKTTYLHMNINRPFLFKFWKNDIYEQVKKLNLEYHEDYTNEDNRYVRNKIRNTILKNASTFEKTILLNHFLQINQTNLPKLKQIKKEYGLWSQSKFDIKKFFNFQNQEDLIKMFINKRMNFINLNQNIIRSIIAYISTQNSDKRFLLSGNNYLYKKRNKLYFYKSNKI